MRATVLLFALAACDAPEESCPPCECKCECAEPAGTAPVAAGSGAAPVPDGGGGPPVVPAELGELVGSASRKMLHEDGAGCLADLDRIAAADPGLDARLAVSRGQCEMLVGRCQEGKARVAAWYEDETNLTPERAAAMAETLGSMRCRGGNASERDRLLAALFDLSDGAYMNKRDSAYCKQRVATIRQLAPRVPPRDVDDTQLSGGVQALFHTAAACYARAGDCKEAYRIYRELFPAGNLSAIGDAAAREKVVREAFESSIERCRPRP